MSFGKNLPFRFALSAFMSLALVLSVFAPLSTPEADAAVADWQKGVSIVSRWSTDFESESFKQSVRNAKSMGANYVTLIIPYMQDNYQSSNIYATGNTPSDATLGTAIDYIQSQGMKVALKPHLEVSWSGGWRALIESSDRNAWYASYSAMLNRLGDVGSRHGAEMIVVGTELIGMASPYVHPNNTERWVTMINNLRTRYSGLLTYSANWGKGINHTNEFEQIGFWSSLDYIGVSAYFELHTDNSVSSLKNAWATIDRDQVGPLQARVGKPVLFTEIGYRSVDNAHYRPWDYEMGGNYNAGEQQNAYQALIEYWNTKSYFAGIMIWDWSSDPNYGWEGNTDYTPHNKPAETLIRNLFTATSPTPTPDPTPTPNPNPNPNPNPTPTPTPQPTPTPTGTFSAAASSPAGASVGTPKTFQVTVMNSGQAQNVIADIEIYDSANTKVFQKFFEGQSISQSTPGQYSVTFTPTANGNHTLKVGVFNSNWSTNYYWNDSVLPFTVGTTQNPNPTPDPTPQPTTYTTDIWWPTDGTAINGVQPFKAMLQGKSVSEYEMYWQVEGGALTVMANSDVDWPHKEVLVDVSGWKWKGEGPYRLNFVSKAGGVTLSERSVDVYVR
jgi:hypothetical protein